MDSIEKRQAMAELREMFDENDSMTLPQRHRLFEAFRSAAGEREEVTLPEADPAIRFQNRPIALTIEVIGDDAPEALRMKRFRFENPEVIIRIRSFGVGSWSATDTVTELDRRGLSKEEGACTKEQSSRLIDYVSERLGWRLDDGRG